MRSTICCLLSFLLLLVMLACAAIAQVPTGGVRGVVTDPSKAVIVGAKITVTNTATGHDRAVTTNSSGEFQVGNLQPGEYEIIAVMSGFKTQITVATVLVGDNLTANFTLEVGRTSETVVITSETPTINTTDYKVDGVVTRQQIESLPLNGRNFLQLAILEPGVLVQSVGNPGTSPNNFFRVSIAGAGQGLTRISVDGATVNDRVTGGSAQNFSQEMVQEFQISTFNFDISTGVTSVGAINVVSRTGKNDLHGSGFFYFRDNNLAAFPGSTRDPRRFINPDRENPFFARRQSGFTASGPLKKDRLFWFFSFEHNNQDGVFAIDNNHPIFSQFDHIADNPLTANQANARFDWRINQKHNAFLRLSTDNNDNFNPSGGVRMPSNWVVSDNVAAQALGGLSSVLTPRLVNDLRFSYGFYSNHLENPTSANCPDPIFCLGLGLAQINVGGFRIGNNTNAPQNRVLRTYQLTDTLSWHKSSHRLRFGGEWERFHGQGSWAFASPAILTLWDPISVLQQNRTLYDLLPDSLKLNSTGTGPLAPGRLPTFAEIIQLPLRTFSMGVGDPGQPPNFRREDASRNDRYRFFAQDSWRVAKGFTFSYGASYTYENRLLNHDLDRPALLSPLLNGNLSGPRRDKNNFAPSSGFAWDVGNNGKTVIRGGVGIYHDSNFFWTRLQERALTGPAGNGRAALTGDLVGLSFNNVPTSYLAANLLPTLPAIIDDLTRRLGNGQDLSVRGIQLFKQGDRIFDPDTTIGYAANVTIGVQHQLAHNLVAQADYVMRRSIHFGGLHDTFLYDRNRFERPRVTGVDPTTGVVSFVRNPVIPRCSSTPEALNPLALCSTGAIRLSESSANFRYTGLHLKVEKRFSNRYFFTGSYALSKFTGFNEIINYDNFFEADGYQGGDRRHKFTFSGSYEFPIYKGSSRLLRGLLNSWKAGLISQTHSKPPLNLVIGNADPDGDGLNTLILPGAKWNSYGRAIDASKLRELVATYNQTLPTVVTGKRTPQNQVIPPINLPAKFDNGDWLLSQDLRVTRLIRFKEKFQLSLIGEGFNIFNFSNLIGYGGALNGANFGQPGGRIEQVFGTGGPRAFQFAARFVF